MGAALDQLQLTAGDRLVGSLAADLEGATNRITAIQPMVIFSTNILLSWAFL